MAENKACPVCESVDTLVYVKNKDLEYLSSDTIYTYHECKSCASIFIDEFPTDKLSEIYPSNYYSFLEQKKNLALRVKEYLDKRLFKKILSEFEGKSINILDIGGGSGWLLDIIKSVYKNVNITQVVDIDENAKLIAERNGHQFFHGPIQDYRSEVHFDLVLMLNLIEHISDPKETLVNIEQMMNPGGIVLIKTPNTESLDARLFKKSYWGGLHCPRHWILFSKKSFNHMIAQTNLTLSKIKYTQGAPFWAWSVLIRLQKAGWVKISKERPVMYHPLIPLLHIFFAGFDFLRGAFGAKTSQMFIELKKKG